MLAGVARAMRSGRHAPLAVGLLVTVLAGVALTITHHPPRPAMPAERAVKAALSDADTRQALAGSHWTSTRVEQLDTRTERVTFYAGHQLVADIALKPDGKVLAGVNDRQLRVPYGDWIAYEPAVVVGLCALFVLMTGVTPWRRLRNLDVAASLSLVISVVLFQHRYIGASMIMTAPGMLYLLVRCARYALGVPRVPPASTPLLVALAPGVSPARRVRWLRTGLVVLALVIAMVGLSSPFPVDVVYAVMEGASRLVHGVLPYGHMPPGIVHGDTYPILSYAFYTPLALVSPVSTEWDSVAGGLAVAVAAALVTAWGVFKVTVGARAARAGRRPPEVEEAGLRAALAWLAFPPVLITASTGTTDVVLGAMLVMAVLLWRRPTACNALLALAGWFKLAPFILLPVSLAPLRGRRLLAAVLAIGAVSLAALAVVLTVGGIRGASDMVHAIAYQFSRGSLQSIWGALGLERFQPLAQACVVGLIAVAVVKVRREPDLALDRNRMAALTAAILIGLQLSASYWAFLYLVWVVPLVSCALFADVTVLQPADSRVRLPRSLDPAASWIR